MSAWANAWNAKVENRNNPVIDWNDPVMRALMNDRLRWGNVPSDSAVENVGLDAAVDEIYVSSPRRSSSGRTSSIQRRGGRKARKEHYTRKAILERQKEEERRRVWERRHPGGRESNWLKREAERKTRKAAKRQGRRR